MLPNQFITFIFILNIFVVKIGTFNIKTGTFILQFRLCIQFIRTPMTHYTDIWVGNTA